MSATQRRCSDASVGSSHGETARLIDEIAAVYRDLLVARGYPNAGIIAEIFRFWVADLLMVCVPSGRVPERTLELVVAVGENVFRRATDPKSRPWTKRITWWLLQQLPIPYGYLPGGAGSRIEALIANIYHYKLFHLTVRVDDNLRSSLLREVDLRLPAGLAKAVHTALPDVFFLRLMRGARLPARLRGSPSALTRELYLRGLFTRTGVRLTGLQHGGCYGEFRSNRWEALERRISDRFLYWGLGDENIRQHRFPMHAAVMRRPTQVALVGSVLVDPFLESYFGGFREIGEDADRALPGLAETIRGVAPVVYLPHPKSTRPPPLDLPRSSLAEMDEAARTRTLFVIDRPGHTFLYRAVYERLPFLIVLNEEWSRWLTPAFQEYLVNLRNVGLAFYRSEMRFLSDRVGQIVSHGYPAHLFSTAQQHLEHRDDAERDRAAAEEVE